MRKLQKIFFGVFIVVLLVASGIGTWLLFFQGRAPEARPDLVHVPADVPPPPEGYPTRNAAFLAYALGFVELVDPWGAIPIPEGVVERTDIDYGREGVEPLLDLYYPANIEEPAPGLIFIHGGSWSSGGKTDYKLYTTHFAKLGYVTASISYRLKGEAKYPAAIEDAKCAVRWMRAHAEQLHVDPERIAVIGGSAGGHLSMLVGYAPEAAQWNDVGGYAGVSSEVAAVVDLYGPADLTAPIAQDNETVTSYLDATFAANPERFTEASPLTYVDPGDPITLVIHGTTDQVVPVEQSDRLVEKFQQLDMPYWYARLDGWMHALDIVKENNDYCTALFQAFFEEHLAPPPPPAAPVDNPPDLWPAAGEAQTAPPEPAMKIDEAAAPARVANTEATTGPKTHDNPR
ncbi:MAG: alpha/beta hydrolase fold domain-containing protein [Candidatus Hydrogenedentota bacterium]